jgi:hypothetical protein
MPHKYNGKHLKLWTPATYRIEVEGDLDESLSERLGGMRITRRRREDQTAVTTLEGRVRDQAELAGVMNSLYELHLPILSVQNLTEKNGEAGHDPDKSSPSEPEREDST